VTNSRVREVTQEKEVVYSVVVTESKFTNTAETYQAERMPLYVDSAYDYNLGEIQGVRLGTQVTNSTSDMIQAPGIFFGNTQVNFKKIYLEKGRLVAEGSFTYDGKTYMLGRAFLILRSKENTYVYGTSNSINGLSLRASIPVN
jgi:hypothetical protein